MEPSNETRPAAVQVLHRLMAEVRPDGGEPLPPGSLADWGLTSLALTRLWVGLRREYGLDLPPKSLGEATLEDLLAQVSAEGGAAPDRSGPRPADPVAAGPEADDPHAPFPVTDLQQSYLVAKEADLVTDSVGCHLYREFTVADLDPDRLRRAWQDLVEHHDMLRAVVDEDGTQRIQQYAPDWELPVHAADAADGRASVRERLSHHRYLPGEWPLFAIEVTRTATGRDVVHLSLDTLITDGHGYALLLQQWHERYHHPERPLPSTTRTPRACVLALAAERDGEAHRADQAYWAAELAELPPGPRIVRDPPADSRAQGPAGCRPRLPLDGALTARQWQALTEAAARMAVSPTALVLTVFAEALDRAHPQQRTSLVVTTSVRPYLPVDAAQVVGPFTSTAVHVIEESADEPFEEATQAVHARLSEHLRHGLVSGIAALRELRVSGPGGPGGDHRAPAVVFTSLLGVGPRPGVAGGFGSAVEYGVSQTSDIALDHQMWEQDGELRYRWDVDVTRFAPGAVEAAFAAFANGLAVAACPEPVAEPQPLRELQEAYLVARSAAGRQSAEGCQCYQSFAVDELDVGRLAAAVRRLVDAHPVLRTEAGPEGLLVRPHLPERWHIPVIDAAGEEEHRALCDRIRAELTDRPFPLGRWPLFELRVTRDGDGRCTVHCAFDLLVADGQSIHRLFRELWRLYDDPAAHSRPGEPAEEYLPLRSAGVGTAEHAKSAGYWQDRLVALPAGPELPVATGAERSRTRLAGHISGYRRLRERAAEHGLHPDDLLLAALTRSLSSHFERDYAVPVVLWPEQAEPLRPGEFSFMTWITGAPADRPLAATARSYRRQLDEDLRADGVSALAEMRRLVLRGRRDAASAYPVVYTALVDLTDHPLPDGVRQGRWLTSTPGCSLDCVAVAEGDRLDYCWDVVAGDFPAGTAGKLFAEFERNVGLLADDATWTEGLSPLAPDDGQEPAGHDGAGGLSEDEREKVLYRWNDTAVPLPDDGPAYLLFQEQARRAPDAVALRWRGGTMTYGELNRRANRIARRLSESGTGPQDVVGVRVHRGPEMVAALYGVLKAGAAYLPIDPALPEARVATMLGLARAGTVLTSPGTPSCALPAGVRSIVVDTGAAGAAPSGAGSEADEDPEPRSTMADPAYVIFTSGSTGTPKGVTVAHRSVRNLLNFCYRTFDLSDRDLGLAVTSLGFDLSVFDMLGLLGRGAGVYLADEEQQRDPELLLDILLTEPVTIWNSAPTTLHQLTPLLEPARSSAATTHLRLVLLSGDFIPLSLPGRIREVFSNAETIALGGPTETTVWSNFYRVTTVGPDWRSIPYGRPIDNTRHYVLDARMQPCPIGVEGDLYTGGECLAVGFCNAPELTAELFLPDPFVERPGERIYRTGDRALWMADGNLSIVGRGDGQVKIRGHRVELGEIEHCLRTHPAVQEAVVLVRPGEPRSGGESDDAKLVAYVIADPAAGLAADDLRAHAAAALPAYMVPNFVALLGTFPATANGKLDRKALPWPLEAGVDAPPADGPSTPALNLARLSDEVSDLFARHLGLPSIDPVRDLWDQGATSFTMVQVSAALKKRYRQRVPVSALISEPTAAGIARFLAETLGVTVAESVPPSVLPSVPPSASHATSPPVPPSAPRPVPEPAAGRTEGPGAVDMFSPQERDAFKAAAWNLRRTAPGAQLVALPAAPIHEAYYDWRGSRRDFLDAPLPTESFARLLSLLREASVAGGRRHLYPSAGDTYAVQVYLHLRPGAVEGITGGIYYYHPREHALELVNPDPGIDRSAHFYYNRPVFDGSGFGIFLIGQTRGIEPLYQEVAERFLMLEAGYVGQLLMTGQAACGVGLCPVGTMTFAQIRDEFRLDEGHVFLHALMGGRVEHAAVELTPPFADRSAVSGPPDQRAETASVESPERVENTVETGSAEVAVVGMAGRFPGADDLAQYWQRLSSGDCAVGPLPAGRGLAEDGRLPSGLNGGFLADIEQFDSLLFRIAPAEAATLDPQLRLLLQTVWSCLEDAGHTPDSLRAVAPRVGVFTGTMWHDYQHLGKELWEAGAEARVSALTADIPSRISHFFGFDGPSIAVDTSCSSSLTALHLAVESLRRGECDAALVGAANLITHPYHLALLSEAGLLARGGPVRAFAADGSGWCPGEGVAAVLLRPARAASRAGDRARGVVEATWAGHSGGRGRYGVPDTEALAGSIGTVLSRAGVRPGQIDYVECAAAGASVADAAELEALGEVFADSPVLAGTVKPNIGHLESASGLSQLIKVLLQFGHGRIAPTLAADARTPLVDWDELSLELPGRVRDWPSSGAGRRALVNAVGASGSYGHVVIRAEASAPVSRGAAERQAVVLSAASAGQLRVSARRLAEHLAGPAAGPGGPNLSDLAFTLQDGRVPMAHRLAVVCADLPELRAALEAFGQGRPWPGVDTAVVSRPAESKAEIVPVDAGGAAASWLAGSPVAWHTLWAPDRRRVALPGYPFAAQEHRPAVPEPSRPDGAAADASGAAAREYVLRIYAEVSGIPVERLDPYVPLEDYGLTSYLIGRLNGRLAEDFAEPVSRTLFFERTDLAGIAAELATRTDGPWRPEPAAQPVTVPVGEAGGGGDEDAVAVIGIAGRYPKAPDLDRFWDLLLQGGDATGQLPENRRQPGWPVELMWGSFLDDVDRFDPLFFKISPRDAVLMDPQERLFLEVAWEALEDAGYTRARLRERHGGRVGVYAGAMYNEYPFFGVEQSLTGTPSDTGSAIAGIANRVSYFLDLHGPSLTVDTMCSASLTAIHLALRALRSGECEAALVGGVNLSLHPHKFRQQNRLRMASTDHRCRSFGAGGDGFTPGEGAGTVLLKPLARAVADGDRIHAVIRGSAVNHGGRTNGYMVPSPVAQGELVAEALRDAGVDPRTISYLEAHGTGTALGDPVEVGGLIRAFDGVAAGACAIGSVKSNIGHLEAAAGMAGLTKVILQLRHRVLVPSLHTEKLNADIDWAACPFVVQREVADWAAPPAGPLRAGISAFGAGGANAHVVVEEYVPQPVPVPDAGRPVRPQLVVLSARDDDRLAELAGRWVEFLARPVLPPMADLAHTLQSGREPMRERLAVVASDPAELRDVLIRFLDGDQGRVVRGRTPGADAPQGPAAPESAYRDLTTLARHWTGGGSVDWARLHRGDQPRPAGVPAYPFARERYWPAPAVVPAPANSPAAGDEMALPTGGAQAGAGPAARESGPDHIPAQEQEQSGRQVLLHTKTWEPAELAAGGGGAPVPGQVVCLYTDRSWEAAHQVVAAFGRDRVTLVREGGPAGATSGFTGERDGVALLDALADRQPDLAGWIDLCDLDRDEDDPGPWPARLAMLQRLIARRRGTPLRILQAVCGLQALGGDFPQGHPESTRQDPPPSLAGARTAGFVRLLGAEYRAVRATVCDSDATPPALARQLLAEWASDDPTAEICYRGEQRYRPLLSPTSTPAAAEYRADPAKVYLITGGTRGIGALVARRLVDRGARRLALVSANPLPPRHRWNDADLSDTEAVAVGNVQALERAGAQVLLHAAAATADADAGFGAFLDRVRGGLGPIGGVIHCAGLPSRGQPSFIHKTTADLQDVIEPKITMTEQLDRLCAADSPEFFVLMSSMSGVVPRLGVGVSDYAAGNAFLDYFTGRQARAGRTGYRCVHWPTWLDTGMGAAHAEACAPAGLDAITAEEGLRVLESALATAGPDQLLPCVPLDGRFDAATLLHAHRPPASRADPTAATTSRQQSPPLWLAELFSQVLAIPLPQLDSTAPFGDLGLESVMLGEVVQLIEQRIGRSLEPAVLLDNPTLDRLGNHLREQGLLPQDPMTETPAQPQEQPRTGTHAEPREPAHTVTPAQAAPEPPADRRIAILGLDCRFPGARDAAAFWANLAAGRNSVAEVPASRWDHHALYRPRHELGRSISRWGGFIDGIEEFDHEYFGMSEEEATCLDPAVRLILEGAAGCLADAGYRADELGGREVGVFVGARLGNYGDRVGLRTGSAGLGTDQNFAAARVAHHFDLHGPNLVVDSACSSGLVAIQLACRSLLDGESELAIAGGVDILLDEKPYLEFSAVRALSPTGRCATFDRDADGFVPGEGCGVVLLKPLARALADGDRVMAVIDAVAVNNDGRTMGLTTPNPTAQGKAVRRALALSGLTADRIGMIEAHGTGTMIGDPIEVRALTDVFRESTDRRGFCAVGSVKSNIGHLLSAAGMAGLAKAVLALNHRQIPPTLHCETPNPRFDFADSPFYPNTALREWPSDGQPRVAGVSAFGLGGTNAHLIVSEPDAGQRAAHPQPRRPLPRPVFNRRRHWLEPPPARSADDRAATPAPRRGGASILDLNFRPGPAPRVVLGISERTNR